MLEKIIASIIFGYIMGGCTVLILIMFLIGAHKGLDDTESDFEGFKDYMEGRRVKKAKRMARGMTLDKKVTSRGFGLIEFTDLYDAKCNIQKSSLATCDAIWLGVKEAEPKILASKVQAGGTGWVKYDIPEDVLLTTRMHLTRGQIKTLLPILKRFIKTGEIY